MAQNKTQETDNSVSDFLETVSNETMKKDSYELLNIFEEVTGFKARMWGPAIIGFGRYHYKYDSGREGDAPIAAFSPRKVAISLYLDTQFEDKTLLLSKFGKHKAAKSCIYIKKLSDVSIDILKIMIANSTTQTNRHC